MRHHVEDDVDVALYHEIEPPVAVHARLSDVLRFVVLLARREGCRRFCASSPGLLQECLSRLCRGFVELIQGGILVLDPHQEPPVTMAKTMKLSPGAMLVTERGYEEYYWGRRLISRRKKSTGFPVMETRPLSPSSALQPIISTPEFCRNPLPQSPQNPFTLTSLDSTHYREIAAREYPEVPLIRYPGMNPAHSRGILALACL